MKHKTWFRLVIKAIGVLLVGFSLPTIWRIAFDLVGILWAYLMASDYSLSPYGHGYRFLQWLREGGLVVQFVFGLYLFFGGKWIVNKVIPSNRPYCPECGYDLSKTRSAKCPECGTVLPPTNSAALP